MTATTGITRYVQIIPGNDRTEYHADSWTPWLHTKSDEETACLAAHKFYRAAGYRGERVEMQVLVTDGRIRHPNGRFATCNAFVLAVGGDA